MRKVLFIFGQLRDTDVDRLSKLGKPKRLAAGSVLIAAGVAVEHLYIVLEGELSVVQERTATELARLSAGELTGEMSFIEARPPSVTVRALTDVVVCAIDKQLLQSALDDDEGFAARFYKAVATFLSDRVRKATGGDGRPDSADELDDAVLDHLDRAGARFDAFARRVLNG